MQLHINCFAAAVQQGLLKNMGQSSKAVDRDVEESDADCHFSRVQCWGRNTRTPRRFRDVIRDSKGGRSYVFVGTALGEMNAEDSLGESFKTAAEKAGYCQNRAANEVHFGSIGQSL